jgi:transforming growth factor-beta-induced protein
MSTRMRTPRTPLALAAILAGGLAACGTADEPPTPDMEAPTTAEMPAPGAAEIPGADPMDHEPGTLVEVAAEAGTFETLLAAAAAAGLVEALDGEGPYTLFAPTDDAFAALPEGTVEALLADPEALAEVLLYHVVSGVVTAEQVVTLSEAQTAQGGTVSISVEDGVVLVNGATVVATDIEASNGVIHVIDAVLLPNGDDG